MKDSKVSDGSIAGGEGESLQFQRSEESSAKLTKWKNEPSVADLKRDLDAARPSHNTQLSQIERWEEMLQVSGASKPTTTKGRSSVQPKLIRRQAEWRYSALTEPFLGSTKLFKVEPATHADVEAARQNEVVLNWQFRTKLNTVQFIDNYVRSTVDEGTCIVRVGWKRVTIPIKQQVPVWQHVSMEDEESAQAFQQALQQKQDSPREFEDKADPAMKAAVSFYEESGTPTIARQIGEQEITVEKVIENRPTVEVLAHPNVFIDPSCNGDLDRAMFTVISFETCKADLLKEPKKYKNLEQVNWSSNSPAVEPNHATQTPAEFVLADTARRRVVAYEYWGFWDAEGDGKLVPFVATWIGDTLIRLEGNPYPDEKLPIVLIPYMPKKRALYGEPDAELLNDNQKILGAVFRGMIDLLGRSANGQQGISKGMLDPLNRRRYENGQDYEFNPTMSPLQGIIEHKFPELPQSALAITQMVNQEAEALTGVKSFSGGLSGNAYGELASNARDMLDAASKREMAILRRLAKGMSQIGDKIIAMNAEFMSEEEVIRITDEEFVTVKREDLKGNFNLIVDISTAEADAAKASDMAFMLQTCGPNAGPQIMMMIMADIAQLKRMPELAHKLRNYKPPPPSPEQQQLMQLQLQEAQLKVQKLQAEIQLIGAKAAEHGSNKDLKDLDFVEQETGTKHARDMEKMEAQSRGNQNLQVTKALTTPLKDGHKSPNVEAAIGYNALSAKLSKARPI